jgi:hypothetical protein
MLGRCSSEHGDGTLGIMATSIWGLVGAPCSRNAWKIAE